MNNWVNNSQKSQKLNLSYKILYTSQSTGRSGWCMFGCTLTHLRSLLPCLTYGSIFTFKSFLTIKLIPVLLRYGTSVKQLMLYALHNQLSNYNQVKQWSAVPHTHKDGSLSMSFNKCMIHLHANVISRNIEAQCYLWQGLQFLSLLASLLVKTLTGLHSIIYWITCILIAGIKYKVFWIQ
jgi:hypothetical protein